MSVSYLPFITPRDTEWQYIGAGGAFFSATSGVGQTISRPGGRWEVTLTYPPLSAADRAKMKAFVASLDGQSNRFYLHDHSYSLRGSFDDAEMVSNWDFSNGITGWTSLAPANLSIAATGGGARLTRVTTTNSGVYPPVLTTVNGQAYSVAAVYSAVRSLGASETVTIRASTTSGGTELMNTASSETSGRLVGTFTASGASTYVKFHLTGTGSAGTIVDLHSFSVAKCFLVAGGSQTGSVLAADGAATSQTGLLVEGDWIEVPGSGLHMVTADVDSDGSGNVYIPITPSLRASPTDNAPVVLRLPSMKAILSQQSSGWSNRIGAYSDFIISAREMIE